MSDFESGCTRECESAQKTGDLIIELQDQLLDVADRLCKAAKDYLYSPIKPCCLAESTHCHYDPILKTAREAVAEYEKLRPSLTS